MPLTKQIIQDVVREEIKSALSPVNEKLDKLTEIMTDFAGQFKKFDEEQTVLSGRQSGHSDRLEKLEVKVFGQSTS